MPLTTTYFVVVLGHPLNFYVLYCANLLNF